ncbi:hypothetical protein DSO57_1007297 [Entomophthora muscae]|uniref:Uncharacterized protein n=1 Tax=Entomophthora muscae TaxID=34485 RepID=A0ACC2RM78_9FUNG|nr:hypothetical protein DSO57_1007297 [Entomophthora muscae]
MMLPLLKFFSVLPVLLFLCSTSKDVWKGMTVSMTSVKEDPSSILHILDDLPVKACDALMSDGVFLQSLVPNKKDYLLTQELVPHSPVAQLSSPLAVIIKPQVENHSPLWVVPSISCTSWLLLGLS